MPTARKGEERSQAAIALREGAVQASKPRPVKLDPPASRVRRAWLAAAAGRSNPSASRHMAMRRIYPPTVPYAKRFGLYPATAARDLPGSGGRDEVQLAPGALAGHRLGAALEPVRPSGEPALRRPAGRLARG